MKDEIFKATMEKVPPFEFNNEVACVFDDMISRSVPDYNLIQELTVSIVDKVAQSGDTVVDIGCSTGTTLAKLAELITNKTLTFVGIESSPAMVNKANQKLSGIKGGSSVSILTGDITSTEIPPCKIAIMHYVLQFIPTEERASVLKMIYNSIEKNGIFIFSEKIRMPEGTASLIEELYYEFKKSKGYSALEISQKREALENVLIPNTWNNIFVSLHDAGFKVATPVFQRYQFVTFIAAK